MARTYIPQLRFVLRVAKRYIDKWQTKLQNTLTPAQYTCVTDTLVAITSCLIALGEEVPNP